MMGRDVGTLRVYLYTLMLQKLPLWVRSGNFSDRWLHAEVLIEKDDVLIPNDYVSHKYHGTDLLMNSAH